MIIHCFRILLAIYFTTSNSFSASWRVIQRYWIFPTTGRKINIPLQLKRFVIQVNSLKLVFHLFFGLFKFLLSLCDELVLILCRFFVIYFSVIFRIVPQFYTYCGTILFTNRNPNSCRISPFLLLHHLVHLAKNFGQLISNFLKLNESIISFHIRVLLFPS